MGLLKEFRDFAMRGNVIDLAVGVVIGGAFGKIVSSLVGDVFMPMLSAITENVDFTNLKYTIRAAAAGKDAITLNYGTFLQTIIDFLIISFCIFMAVKAMNSFHEAKKATPPEPTASEKYLAEIRDLLKERRKEER